MTTSELSERRAPDRKKMASAIEALVLECGAKFVRGSDIPSANVIKIYIKAAEGLELMVDFDGKSPQPNIHVLSWYMDSKSAKRLNNSTFGGNVNPYHFQKATYIAYGFADLCKQLRAGLLMAKDGTAFLPH